MDSSFNDVHLSNLEAQQRLRTLVVDSIPASASRRAYGRAIDKFFGWYLKERPSTGLTKGTVQSYRSVLIKSGLSSSSINLDLTAIRRLAAEAADNGLITSEIAMGIARIKGVKRIGLRIGNWLSALQAEQLMEAPDSSTLKGKRDYGILALLIGCGLRREEAAHLELQDIQRREGRWVIIDILGKGNRTRSIPVPLFAKEAIDTWVEAAGFSSGRIFRPLNRGGRISGKSITGQSILEIVTKYTAEIGVAHISPHNLRRTFARLAHNGKSSLEQIQLSLGHRSVAVTESYVGVKQDLQDAPCDRLGLRPGSRNL